MEERAGLGASADIQRDLTRVQPRSLPDEAIVHQPAVRYTQAQMEMRPVDRADAALMAIVEPESFKAFVEAIATDGDWRTIVERFSQKLKQHPEWLEDKYRLPAADLLKRSNYLMDLSVLLRFVRGETV